MDYIIDGRYRVEKELGGGGMGRVFLVEDTQLGRKVALKQIKEEYAQNQDFVRRFIREATVMARVEDIHCVRVYDLASYRVKQDGEYELLGSQTLLYITMEYVDGVSLQEEIKAWSGGMAAEKAMDILTQMSLGLDALHKAGGIHRDVKPANVLLAKTGAKIADFGLARLDEMTQITSPAAPMGTLDYMSPEQWRDPSSVDHRTDLYSVGLIFYEMLTGKHQKPPFDYPEHIPPPYRKIIDKLTADVKERYPDTEALLDELSHEQPHLRVMESLVREHGFGEPFYMGSEGFYKARGTSVLLPREGWQKDRCQCLSENNRDYWITFSNVNPSHEQQQSFLRRALFLKMLRHENKIVTVKDFSINPRRCFMISYRVKGHTLEELLERVKKQGKRGLSIREALWILRDLASALEHLAEFSFVHRAIHPKNILLEKESAHAYLDGVEYLTRTELEQLSLTRAVPLTRYSAPEEEKQVLLTPQTDTYSLGVLFYDMIEGLPRKDLRQFKPKLPRFNFPKSEDPTQDLSWLGELFRHKSEEEVLCRTILKYTTVKKPQKRWTAAKLKRVLGKGMRRCHFEEDMKNLQELL